MATTKTTKTTTAKKAKKPAASAKTKAMRKKADEILKQASSLNADQNFFFETTFERYLYQIELLDDLEAAIKAEGTLVEKEYVKGRKNLTINPAVTNYNATSGVANQTMSTLLKILSAIPEQCVEQENKDQSVEEFAHARTND